MGWMNLALLKRTVMMDARSWQLFIFRSLLVFCIFFMLFVAYISSSSISATGLQLFGHISFINVFFITVVGIAMFSSMVTEEKEINSLNLLLMTGITPFSLLLSKAMSKLFVGITLLLAQLPFTILAITLGGVSLKQVVAVFIVLSCFIAFVCFLCLFASVLCRRSAEAACLAFVVICMLIFNPLLGGVLSPGYEISLILSTSFSGSIIGSSSLLMLALCLFFFLASLVFFNFCNRTQTDVAPSRMLAPSRQSKLSMLRVTRAWRHPLIWKDFFFLSGGKTGIAFRLFLILFCCGLIILLSQNFLLNFSLTSMGFWLMFVGYAGFVIDAIVYTSRVFRREIDEKTLATLMMLPDSLKGLFYSKLVAVVPCLCIWLLPLGLGFLFNLYVRGSETLVIILFTLYYLVAFCFYLHLLILFSLFLKYGAFAVALVAYFFLAFLLNIPAIFFSFLLMALTMGGGMGPGMIAGIVIYGFTALIYAGGIWVLQLIIIARLKYLSSTL